MSPPEWTIVGQGLAGTCLAWDLWRRGVEFTIIDREFGGTSRVAAGLINPVTGKNFEPSARIAEFLPEAMEFYAAVEKIIHRRIWHPLPVLRLADSESEWEKMLAKATHPEVARWIGAGPSEANGWKGSFEIHGGGRLDTRAFLDASRDFFKVRGFYETCDAEAHPGSPRHIWCEGAAGLLSGKYGPHRCAKGEILTIRAAGWDEKHIRVGAGGWLVPLGAGKFKAGSTYDWDQLDETPTEAGKTRVEGIIRRLGGGDFEILHHEAAVRPILRRSEPLIGPVPGGWMFNALGSKGSLYAPGMARKLACWIIDGVEPEPGVDYRFFAAARD